MSRYVTTGDAARELGISTATLTRWAAAGLVVPAERTAGGHYRWDLPVLRAQVQRLPRASAHLEPRAAVEDIARVVHAANRELQIVQGDPRPSPPWDEASEYQVRESIDSVQEALRGITPEQSHETWCSRLRADGWQYGEVKDERAKTHPCLVPFAELPEAQQRKDAVLVAIVQALAPRADVR
jgi:DNA-binding transcriptional MerR regulator